MKDLSMFEESLEVFIELTNNDREALILLRLLCSTYFDSDFDSFLNEEARRQDDVTAEQLYHGWLRFPAKELKKETLLTVSEETIRRYTFKLVKKGYLFDRKDSYRFDRSKNYRLNLRKIIKDSEKKEFKNFKEIFYLYRKISFKT